MSIRSTRLTDFLRQMTPFCQKFEATFRDDKVNFSKAKKSIQRTRISNGTIGLVFVSIIFYMYAPCLFFYAPGGACQTSSDVGLAWFSFGGVVCGAVISVYQDTLLICLLHIIQNMLSEASTRLEKSMLVLVSY